VKKHEKGFTLMGHNQGKGGKALKPFLKKGGTTTDEN